MGTIKAIFKNRSSLIWFIVTAFVLVLVLTVNIVAMATQLSSTINLFLPSSLGPRPIVGERTLEMTRGEARAAGLRLGEEIAEEGSVMLKNNGALPLASGAKISVFGKNSVNLSYGGSGSGGKTLPNAKTIFDSLTAAGFTYNNTLKTFYENNSQSGAGRSANPGMESGGASYLNTGETPQASYVSNNIPASYSDFKDVAIILLTRIGGEGWDLPRSGGHHSSNAQNANDHYLQLDKNETELIKAVCNAEFKSVIILLNTNNPMELGFLDDPSHYAYDSRIGACLWIGTPGETGIMALGKILKGDVSPSGRLVDTYSRNFKNDPVWANFGDMDTPSGNRYLTQNYSIVGPGYNFVDYQEGIYVGYRYFETRGYNEFQKSGSWNWHGSNVVYPFGYGLTYAEFTQEFSQKPSNLNLTNGNKFTVKVKVTNTSSSYTKPAKDAIQIYVTPEYKGRIEKSYVVLAGFNKTQAIAPGASQEVEIEIDPYLFASYDENTDGGCFILEGGNYQFRLGESAHKFYADSFTMAVTTAIKFKDGANTQVKNRFADAADPTQLRTTLSRADFAGTMPRTRTQDERRITASTDLKAKLDDRAHNNPTVGSSSEFPKIGVASGLTLTDMIGASFEDLKWKTFIEMLTINEMTKLVTDGQFKTEAIVRSGNVIVPGTTCFDGPYGIVNFVSLETLADYAYYPSQVVLASTWNPDLAKQFGETVGDEMLVGDSFGVPASGWYAPGVNIHRSPFGGRLGEYYSEDSILSGKMAAAVVKGARDKGVMTFVKHFAVNEQETNRQEVATWLSEQALREIYLRPFELTVKEGKTRAIMSSFNRIGTKWAGGDYRLLTEVLRDEWGFKGMVVCDYFVSTSYADPKQMIYAGGDLHLVASTAAWFKPSSSSAADVTILQTASKNILYAVADSNITGVEIKGYRIEIWKIILIVVDIAVVGGLGAWGFFAVRKSLKKEKAKTSMK